MQTIKTLYISYDGMTDALGQSQVIPYLQGLSKKGYKVHLISCEKTEIYELKKSNIQNILTESKIVWHPIFYTKTPPVLSTLWDVFKIKKLAIKLHQKHSFKLVHCRSYIAAIVGLNLQQKFGIKFIFDIRGFWADERIDGGIWNLKNPVFKIVYSYFKRKERHFFETADSIISLTVAAKNHIENNYNLKGTVSVIPCAADLDLFKPQSEIIKQEYRLKLGLQNEFVLLYLGSIGTWYLLDEMMDFFVELKKQKQDAKFVFITNDKPEYIIYVARKKGINVLDVMVQNANRDEVIKYISIANASVFFIKPCFSKMASSPTKHGELLAAQIPVVCNNIGDLKEIVTFKNAGVLVNDFTAKSYQSAINMLDLCINEDHYSQTANKYYALANGQKKYLEVYDKLLRF